MDFFLDSGAFSAFTKGVEIDIIEYCNFIKRTSRYHYTLCRIGCNWFSRRTLKNQKIMEEQGLSNPLLSLQ